jgi:hypothetical protein
VHFFFFDVTIWFCAVIFTFIQLKVVNAHLDNLEVVSNHDYLACLMIWNISLTQTHLDNEHEPRGQQLVDKSAAAGQAAGQAARAVNGLVDVLHKVVRNHEFLNLVGRPSIM